MQPGSYPDRMMRPAQPAGRLGPPAAPGRYAVIRDERPSGPATPNSSELEHVLWDPASGLATVEGTYPLLRIKPEAHWLWCSGPLG